MRAILASNKGTLMELGISPLITSSWIIEMVKNSKMLTYDNRVKEDVRLAANMEKLLAFMVTFGTAFGYVFSGMYGGVEYIGYFKSFMLVFQLTFSGMMVIYLDEVLDKGYGIGSGISLFIACNMCENLFWHAFSPVTIKNDNGIEFEGAFIALIHFLLTKPNKMHALYLAFYRQNIANLHNIFTTVFIFLIVIYLHHLQTNITLVSQNKKGFYKPYAVKLFYLSNTPIMIQTTILGQLHTISSILYQKFRKYSWVRLLAVWQKNPATGREQLIGGFTFYLKPPDGLTAVINDPFHFMVYFLIIVISSGVFAKLWLEISGRSPVDVLRQIKDSGMKIGGTSGKNLPMIKVLDKNIGTAAVLGGVLIGVFSIFSDLIGTIGSGTGIMLTVSIIYSYYEKVKDELKEFSIKDVIQN